ncbi:MAG: 50S ribosomal protein L25 [Candidatus Taylorbacteria bacterium]
MLTLNVEKRDMKVTPEAIRKNGSIPAVFYGPKEASTPIIINAKDFTKTWRKAGQSSVIILKEGNTEHEVLIHDIDVHPLSGDARHADFYVIEKGKKVKVSVKLVYEGVSPAVKDKGAILVKVRREVEVEAAPRDLPHEIKVDISKLVEFTDVIKAKDLNISSGVELKIGADEVIASISEAKEEVEEKPAAIDMSAIEVEAKGKEVKEGEAGAADAKPADAKKDAKKEDKK